MFSKITAMALVAVMACCMAASAYYESLPTELRGVDGKRYIGTTILYEDGTNRFRGSAWVQTKDSSRVPLGTIGCRSGLAYGDSGSRSDADGNFVSVPHFSELFPGWDLPAA